MYLAFAEILAKQSQARYPDIAVDVLPTEGTVDNLARLRSGDVDMGLALADVAERDRATGPADTAPEAVARVYENYLQVIVRDATAAYTSWQTLQGSGSRSGRAGSGAAATSEVLFEAAGLRGRMDMVNYRLRDGLARLADGGIDALVWSGGVPTPAIADLDAELPLRMLDIGGLAAPMSRPVRLPLPCPPGAGRRVRTARHPFDRSARPAAVPPGHRRRAGRRRRGRTRHRRTATGASLCPGAAVPRRRRR